MPKALTKPGVHTAASLKEHSARLVISSAMSFVASCVASYPTSSLKDAVPGICCEALIRALTQHGFFDTHAQSIPSEVSYEEEVD